MEELIKLFTEKVGRYTSGNVQDELRSWAANEITALRQQLANSEARVAELEIRAIDYLNSAPGMADPKDRIKARIRLEDAINRSPGTDAWLLRKQAEAVDDIRKDLLSDLPVHAISKAVDLRLGLRVDSLREKADEAERAGGER